MAAISKTLCFSLNRKQGTHLIGLVELVMTTAVFTMTLLGAAVVIETYNLHLKPDMKEWQDMSGASLDLINQSLTPEDRIDEVKLKMGENLAVARIMYMGVCVTATVIHLISCVLLLFGTVTGARLFLLPWLTTAFIMAVFGSIVLTFCIINIAMGKGSFKMVLGLLLYLHIRFFLWMVVFNHYKEMTEARQWAPVIHHEIEYVKTAGGPPSLETKQKPSEV